MSPSDSDSQLAPAMDCGAELSTRLITSVRALRSNSPVFLVASRVKRIFKTPFEVLYWKTKGYFPVHFTIAIAPSCIPFSGQERVRKAGWNSSSSFCILVTAHVRREPLLLLWVVPLVTTLRSMGEWPFGRLRVECRFFLEFSAFVRLYSFLGIGNHTWLAQPHPRTAKKSAKRFCRHTTQLRQLTGPT